MVFEIANRNMQISKKCIFYNRVIKLHKLEIRLQRKNSCNVLQKIILLYNLKTKKDDKF